MRLLIVADIHIKLGQRKVPKDWQSNRVMLLAEEINKHSDVDLVVIAGDLLDVPKPSVEEVGLMLDFLTAIKKDKLIIPGNHEMVTKKRDCYLPITQQLEEVFNTVVVREFDTETIPGVDLIPYNVIKEDFTPVNELAITHVRGEIPPHVEPEIDLDIFNPYDKVFSGDLHSHKNTQRNIYYPGSPYTTSFHRKPSNIGTTGMFVVDTETKAHNWIQLDLPELLRYTISAGEHMVAHEKHNIIYEVEGDLEELSEVEDSELLDKKVANNIYSEAQLEIAEGASIGEEVKAYLLEIRNVDSETAQRLSNLTDELAIGVE